VALTVPIAVTKILKAKGSPEVKFDSVTRHFKQRVRQTGGCFATVLLCKGFVLKRDRHNGGECSIRKDCDFITRMRSNPKVAKHFPESRMIGEVMIQERTDRNPNLYEKYRRQINALGRKFGVSDVHAYNIGWKTVKGEPIPLFIDVGFRRSPAKIRKAKNPKKLSWFLPEQEIDGLMNYCSDDDSDCSY
jgi:hypothetical protein